MVKYIVSAVVGIAAVIGMVGVVQTSKAAAWGDNNQCQPVVYNEQLNKNHESNCPVLVKPTAPTFTDVCGTLNDTFTIPSTTGVQYYVGMMPISAGTYNAKSYEHTDSVTVTAVAKHGYKFDDESTHSWTKKYSEEKCEPVLTQTYGCDTAKQAFVVTVKNSGDANGMFTLNGTLYTVMPAGSQVASVATGTSGVNITLVVGENTIVDNKFYACVQGQGSVSVPPVTPTASAAAVAKPAAPAPRVMSLPYTSAGNGAVASLIALGSTIVATAAGYVVNRRRSFNL